MSNAVSALNGASFDGFVRVAEAGLRGMITLRGDLSDAKLKKAVKDLTGAAVPKQRAVTLKGDKGVAWMSPDELLVMVPYADVLAAEKSLNDALNGSHFMAVNVSDARVTFTLTGAGAREVLAKVSPVDMAGFTTGEIRRTRLAQVAGAFWISGEDEFTVVAFRSVAQYVFDLLKTAAQPGSEVGYI